MGLSILQYLDLIIAKRVVVHHEYFDKNRRCKIELRNNFLTFYPSELDKFIDELREIRKGFHSV